MDRDGQNRRQFLRTCAGVAAIGTAGCSLAPQQEAVESGTTGQTPQSGTPTNEASATAEPAPGQQTDPPAAAERTAGFADRYVDVYQSTADSVAQVRVLTGQGRGGGAAWVYDDDSIVTNEHVVAGAEEVYARFPAGGWVDATVVGTDVYSDLAVIRVADRPAEATPLALRETDPPVGTEVVALGNPFGFSGSVSAGIVSGVDRTLRGPNDFSIPAAIQTDAPLNPGNSGGPLVDLDGTVAGVANSGGGDNLGFGISAVLARQVIPELLANGSYEYSYMGIRLRSVGPLLAVANDVDRGTGVYVDNVLDDGPSDDVLQGSTGETTIDGVSGISTGGDVIIAMDEAPIPQEQALASFLALETRPGETIAVRVMRDGEERTVDLTLGARPDPA
jgi:serine protease Do